MKATRRSLQVFTLPAGQPLIRLGRGQECEVELPEGNAEVQCVLARTDQGWRLLDRSGQGTRVDGLLRREHMLSARSRIEVGLLRIRLCEVGDEIMLVFSSIEESEDTANDHERGS